MRDGSIIPMRYASAKVTCICIVHLVPNFHLEFEVGYRSQVNEESVAVCTSQNNTKTSKSMFFDVSMFSCRVPRLQYTT